MLPLVASVATKPLCIPLAISKILVATLSRVRPASRSGNFSLTGLSQLSRAWGKRVKETFPELTVGAALARVGFARRGGNVSTSGFSVQLALMGFARSGHLSLTGYRLPKTPARPPRLKWL